MVLLSKVFGGGFGGRPFVVPVEADRHVAVLVLAVRDGEAAVDLVDDVLAEMALLWTYCRERIRLVLRVNDDPGGT